MHKIELNGRPFNGPSSWNELTAERLLNIAKRRATFTDDQQYLLSLVAPMFKIPKGLFGQLLPSQIVQLTECLEWLFEPNDLQKWLIPVLFHGRKRYEGPGDLLSSMTGNEFIHAELHYQRWLFSKDIIHLHHLTAIIYHDRRSKRFDTDKISERLANSKRLAPWFHEAIAINYAGCRNVMTRLHPHVWKAQVLAETDAEPATPTPTNWTEIFLGLAESGKFGDYNSTVNYNVWLLLKDLDRNAQRIEELEARTK